ncbi:hypothetical protein MJH12_15815, partial [bacterium]|nr:hypothetical protein [bacterium]
MKAIPFFFILVYWSLTINHSQEFIYRGIVTDSNGVHITGFTNFEIIFELYNSQNAGQSNYLKAFEKVESIDGVFEITLSEPFPKLESYPWIQITINQKVLSPRTKLSKWPLSYLSDLSKNSERFSGLTSNEFLSLIPIPDFSPYITNSELSNLQSNLNSQINTSINALNIQKYYSKDQILILSQSLKFNLKSNQIILSNHSEDLSTSIKFTLLGQNQTPLIEMNSSGTIYATSYVGDGSSLYNLNITSDMIQLSNHINSFHQVISSEFEQKDTQIQIHIQQNSGNPHQISKSDLGLENITNQAQIPLQFLTNTLNIFASNEVPSSLAVAQHLSSAIDTHSSFVSNLYESKDSSLKIHTTRVDNPHAVNKIQLALDLVENVSVFQSFIQSPDQFISSDQIKSTSNQNLILSNSKGYGLVISDNNSIFYNSTQAEAGFEIEDSSSLIVFKVTTSNIALNSALLVDAQGHTVIGESGHVKKLMVHGDIEATQLTLESPLSMASGGTGATTTSSARIALGLGNLAMQNSNSISITGGSIVGITPLAIAAGGTGANNLIDARNALGLGNFATQNSNSVNISGGNIAGITPLAISDGGTGSNNVTDVRTAFGLGDLATQNSSSINITGGIISGISPLAISYGGTGTNNINDARISLGLGDLATQNANAINITGGTISGITPVA